MFLRAFRRSPLRRYTRAVILLAVFIAFLDLFSLLSKYRTFQHNLAAATVEEPNELPLSLRDQKILICAQFWTSGYALTSHWNDDLLDLIGKLGPHNVYVSIYESGSLDGTKEALKLLDARLKSIGVQKMIVLDPTTHEDEVSKIPEEGTPGWIHTPRSGDAKELRRISYLARLRNKVLQPLYDGSTSMTFDKILFLNDIDFRPSDVMTLLATRNGRYSVACALDFIHPPRYYDTFVLRDMEGRSTATETFPYFRGGESRRSMLEGQATRVQSCWNGMLIMDPAPFIPTSRNKAALQFRGINDSLAEWHLEGSECCLIHADLAAMGEDRAGIWVNPAVRVGYSIKAYEAVHDESGIGWMSPKEYVVGVYRNRVVRWINNEWWLRIRVKKRLNAWAAEGREKGETRVEPGAMCLVDEMQVLIWNGWAHV